MDDEKFPKLPLRKNSKVIDLGIILVIKNRNRDLVFLAHNHVKIFIVTCSANKPAVLWISKKAYAYDEKQWDEIFKVYLAWKRQEFAGFKLPTHSGRRKDGKTHPWRWHPVPKHSPRPE